jgi:hypothetical protein
MPCNERRVVAIHKPGTPPLREKGPDARANQTEDGSARQSALQGGVLLRFARSLAKYIDNTSEDQTGDSPNHAARYRADRGVPSAI